MSGMQQPVLEYHSPSTVVKMRASFVLLAALIAVAYAAGQYYVPRSYYVIDSEGHETAPVPLRRLRRSLPLPGYHNGGGPVAGRPSGGNANAVANAVASDGGTANAVANAHGTGRGAPAPGPLGVGGYANSQPMLFLGASRPKTNVASRAGLVTGHSVSATTNVGVDGQSGVGYYDQEASVEN